MLPAKKIQRIYLTLLLFNTLAASFIWGINTLFLLNAGLNNTEAFSANAFFTAGMVIFEVPTGIVADTRGRRLSYLLGTLTLAFATSLYLLLWFIKAPFWIWAVVSLFLGLGFTFFSGSIEAWLVDALNASHFEGTLESVFAKGQVVEGAGMLIGSLGGGLVAQISNLGVPYFIRVAFFLIAFVIAFFLMKDIGFSPNHSQTVIKNLKNVWSNSLTFGLKNRPVRWMMFEGFFSGGILIYAFYAMQPYLLKLYGNEKAYWIAGLAAAIIAGAQIVGGLSVPYIRGFFRKRTSAILGALLIAALALAIIGILSFFWVVIFMLVIFGLLGAVISPIRQTYLNALIPSEQRATVLSFDSLFSSSGGVVFQPMLGKTADVWGYPASYVASAVIQALAIPFVWLAKREKVSADSID